MNNIYTRFLIFLVITLSIPSNLFGQCNTAIYAARDTIACGESLFLKQGGTAGGLSGDDFNAGTLSGLWQSVTTGWTFTSPCGACPGGQHLWFAGGSVTPRIATTVPVDASCGGNICFDFSV